MFNKRRIITAALLAFATASACGAMLRVPREASQPSPDLCQAGSKRAVSTTVSQSLSMAEDCARAQLADTSDGDPVKSWYAARYLSSLEVYDAAIRSLGHHPSQSGQYLIARQTGVLEARDLVFRVAGER